MLQIQPKSNKTSFEGIYEGIIKGNEVFISTLNQPFPLNESSKTWTTECYSIDNNTKYINQGITANDTNRQLYCKYKQNTIVEGELKMIGNTYQFIVKKVLDKTPTDKKVHLFKQLNNNLKFNNCKQ